MRQLCVIARCMSGLSLFIMAAMAAGGGRQWRPAVCGQLQLANEVRSSTGNFLHQPRTSSNLHSHARRGGKWTLWVCTPWVFGPMVWPLLITPLVPAILGGRHSPHRARARPGCWAACQEFHRYRHAYTDTDTDTYVRAHTLTCTGLMHHADWLHTLREAVGLSAPEDATIMDGGRVC